MTVSRCLCFVLIGVSFAFPCSDPRLQTAVIGGDVIQASALRKPGKPRRFAPVELYFGGKLMWTGTTDKAGAFTINHLQHGTYRLSVAGWISAAVELDPKPDQFPNGQRPSYNLLLSDDACVGVIEVVNGG